MPAAASAALLDGAADPWQHWAPRPGPLGPTSFFNQKCAPGFRCVSKVGVFGLNHDGEFKKPKVVDVDPRFKDAYEWGCPARGDMVDGKCTHDGKSGAGKMCYSQSRYEAGPQTPCDSDDKCLCVRGSTPAGSAGLSGLHSEVKDGKELLFGRFPVQPPQNCEDCSAHSCDAAQCTACENCEYTTKVLKDGKQKIDRKTLGCFDRQVPKEEATGEDLPDGGQMYLEGKKADDRELIIVPHYSLWDPAKDDQEAAAGQESHLTGGVRMPYQSFQEPLSREKWLQTYVQVAPRVQRLADRLARSVVEKWAPAAEKMSCSTPSGDGGPDLVGKIDKTYTVMRACRDVQETVTLLSVNAVPFSDHTAAGEPLNCIHTPGSKEGMTCEALNCYTSDKKFLEGMKKLEFRNVECRQSNKSASQAELKEQRAAARAAGGHGHHAAAPSGGRPGQEAAVGILGAPVPGQPAAGAGGALGAPGLVGHPAIGGAAPIGLGAPAPVGPPAAGGTAAGLGAPAGQPVAAAGAPGAPTPVGPATAGSAAAPSGPAAAAAGAPGAVDQAAAAAPAAPPQKKPWGLMRSSVLRKKSVALHPLLAAARPAPGGRRRPAAPDWRLAQEGRRAALREFLYACE